jgi:hypothetical protein
VESRVEAELEKVRAENFNFRVVRAIKRKLRERDSLENESPEQQVRREREERRKRREERRRKREERNE